MYDLAIWGLFSATLSKIFLPPHSGLYDIFLIFFVGYFFRPIGALFFGLIADQRGRKKALSFTILMMGICTGIIGLLPSYETIGLLATISLLMIRVSQIISVGGEYISSIAILIETGENKRRGYLGSWPAVGVNLGIMLASFAAATVSYLIEKNIVPEQFWRSLFIISFLTSILGYWIRTSIPESFEFLKYNAKTEKHTFTEVLDNAVTSLKQSYTECFLLICLVIYGISTTMSVHILAPVFMSSKNHISASSAFFINSSSLALIALLIPFFGKLSDKYSKLKILTISITTFSLSIFPYFFAIFNGSNYLVFFAQTLISIPCAAIFAITPVFITEIFPVNVRCSVSGFLYSLSSSIGGGLYPIFLINMTKDKIQYGWIVGFYSLLSYLIAIGLILYNKKVAKVFSFNEKQVAFID